MNSSELPTWLYEAYLSGGSSWPQIRAGIILHILHASQRNLLREPITSIQRWRPSDLQLERILSTAKAFHVSAGIDVTVHLDQLRGEYESSIGAVFKSVSSYLTGVPVDLSRRNHATALAQSSIEALKALLSADCKETAAARSRMDESFLQAHSALCSCKDLALLFRLSYYSKECLSRAVSRSRGSLERICSNRFGTPDIDNCLQRPIILHAAAESITRILSSNGLHNVHWAIWDFQR